MLKYHNLYNICTCVITDSFCFQIHLFKKAFILFVVCTATAKTPDRIRFSEDLYRWFDRWRWKFSSLERQLFCKIKPKEIRIRKMYQWSRVCVAGDFQVMEAGLWCVSRSLKVIYFLFAIIVFYACTTIDTYRLRGYSVVCYSTTNSQVFSSLLSSSLRCISQYVKLCIIIATNITHGNNKCANVQLQVKFCRTLNFVPRQSDKSAWRCRWLWTNLI